jgi:hypothetical protein
MSEWISVDERHPTEMTVVLVTDGNHVVPGYHSTNGDEVCYTADGYESFLLKGEITHWQPLPSPPITQC